MLPFKKIICPTDFSEPSYQAMEAAVELAEHFDAKLILAHVVSPVPVVPAPEAPTGFNVTLYQQELEASAQRSLKEIMEKRIPPRVTAEARVVLGNPAGEIVQMAHAEGADLIVIATHGLTGWRRIIFGSVASRVVRLATCAVLTIHAQHAESQEG